MLRKLTVLTLAAALLIGGADTAFAQRGGRGGGGGRGGWSGGGRGWNGGGRGWDGGHNNGWSGFGTGLAIGAGLGYLGSGYGYGGYGYGGYYPSSGYYDGGYYSSAPLYVDPGYTSGVVAPSMAGTMGNGYMAAYPSTQASPNSATINIRVPANAKVFFGNAEASTAQSGMERHFVSPPLDPNSNYQYQLRAQWMQNGQMMDQTRTVDVHANQTVNVDFTQNQTQ